MIYKQPKNPTWISFFINKDKDLIEFGAECDYYIIRKFLPFLNLNSPIPQEKTYIRNGDLCTTIIILSEQHTTVYGTRKSEGVEIHFESGKNPQLTATINLSQEECNIWIQKLNDLLN
ncbi:MAG: hypothetical protein F6K39_19240 [Okeania sp. SIO3B3]|nr:hypothetical protein [Okeania sp. SIO3B3]